MPPAAVVGIGREMSLDPSDERGDVLLLQRLVQPDRDRLIRKLRASERQIEPERSQRYDKYRHKYRDSSRGVSGMA